MGRILVRIFLVAALLAVSVVSTIAAAPPPVAQRDAGVNGSHSDDLPHPLGERRRALRQKALEARLKGAAVGNVYEAAGGHFVEMAVEGEDLIWTVLGEFGEQIDPTYGGDPGPLHNQIPEPDRRVDNSTIWAPDFNRDYYMDVLFSDEPRAISMHNYYLEQSSGRYTVNGDVTDWVQVAYNEARYGNNACGDIVCPTVWDFVQDSLNAWYQSQIDAGMTPEEIDAYLSQYDVWDRYDYDSDGNFDEPDGYIDHFQSVHAGQGEETGGGAQGEDAIWSHRWYAFFNLIGSAGPDFNKFGGVQIGDSAYWVGDYTIEPENGGVGVFAHEFGHDLDLPDLYDTSGNVGGAENSTGFWTIMSSGSYGNTGRPEDGIGNKPTHMGSWEKFQLGWLKYDVGAAAFPSTHLLGPAERTTPASQALIVVLPDKVVTTDLGPPYAGEHFYYSGAGDNLDNRMYREFTLPAGAWLTAQVRYDIEEDWDYAYVIVSTDGGDTWENVETNLSTDENPNGQNFGNGITGSSGGEWVELTADLSAYEGTVLLGFRYWTDGAVTEPGFMVDEISVTGSDTDGAESDAGWTFDPADGFHVTTGTETSSYFNAYVAEFRQYLGFDRSLLTGPYNFGFLDKPELQNRVEHFPYITGLLIWYWDSSHTDNNVGDHPGEGLILPVDAHPEILYWPDGTMIRPRIQTFDSTFGLWPTPPFKVHMNSVPKQIPSMPPVPVFDDTQSYWVDGSAPGRYQPGWNSVKVPNTGTIIEVKGVNARHTLMQVEVRPAE